jgi:hypothetical protein
LLVVVSAMSVTNSLSAAMLRVAIPVRRRPYSSLMVDHASLNRDALLDLLDRGFVS